MVLSALIVGTLGSVGAYRYGRILQKNSNLPTNIIPLFQDGKAGNDVSAKKPVIIVGGGVVGITTAYKLARKGHKVAVVESRSRAAEECSACAAGGMQRANPVVDRGQWVAVLKCLFPKTAKLIFGGEEESFKFFAQTFTKTLTDPFFLRWALTFSTTSLMPDNDQPDRQIEMLKFTDYAVGDMVQMMEDKNDCMAKVSGYNSTGSLSVSYVPVDATATSNKPDAHSKRTLEPNKMLSHDEALALEPSLRHVKSTITQAKFEYAAKSASSERFTKELARRCEDEPELDVTFLYDTSVEAIDVDESSETSRISALRTNRGVIQVQQDAQVIVAAGSWTPRILSMCDLYVPVYPLRGYAISLDARQVPSSAPKAELPSRIVQDKYLFTTRLGDEIRVTSIGEFAGWSTKVTPAVDREFRREAVEHMPQLVEQIESSPTRCGLRPYVNDGILLMGKVDTHSNLFVSCGPGSNGWKLATGSGEILTSMIEGKTNAEIQREYGFDPSAMSPANRVLHSPIFMKFCRARWGW